jgi:hypothetical protein
MARAKPSIMTTSIGLAVAMLAFANVAAAQQFVPYQARLEDGTGAPLADGDDYELVFRIHDAAVDGNVLFGPQTFEEVRVVDGRVDLLIGPIGDAEILGGPAPAYLGVKVGPDVGTAELRPRHQLFPAFHARLAERVMDGGIGSGQISNGAVTNAKLADGAVEARDLAADQVGMTPPGSVIMWWGTLDAKPDGWELCDGEMPTTPNAVYTGRKPDLRDAFLKGATMDADLMLVGDQQNPGGHLGQNDYAKTTGSTTLSRAQLASHEHPHTLSIPPDTQQVPTGGQHDHLGGSEGGLGDNPLLPPSGRDFHCGEWDDVSGEPGPVEALTVSELGADDLPCPNISGGDHSHSIEAEIRPDPAGVANPAHDHTYAANNRPAFRRLYYLIRVL